MELNEFIKQLYDLKSLLNDYNTEKMLAGFSKCLLPKDRSMDEFEKFMKWLDAKQEHDEKANEIKIQCKLAAQNMLDELFEAGLKRVNDLYELTELERLERG